MRACAKATTSSTLRATSFRVGNATMQPHCHVRQLRRLVVVERSTLQLPKTVAAKSIHTLTKGRYGESVSSSLSYAALNLQSLLVQLRWKTRSSSYFSTHADSHATISDLDNNTAPAVTSSETNSTSPSLLPSTEDRPVSSFDSPPSSSTYSLSIVEQLRNDNERVVKSKKAATKYSHKEYQELTEHYIHMNVTEGVPSKNDLDLINLCIRFWIKNNTIEAWKKSSQLYEQLILSLKRQNHKVLHKWYSKNDMAMTYLLSVIVNQWRNIKHESPNQRHPHPTSSTSKKNSVVARPTPSQMLDQVLTWKTMEPILLIDVGIFNVIMAAALDDYSAKDTPIFCESVFRKMLPTQASSVDQRTLPDAYTYTLVLRTWGLRSGSPEAVEHLWHLFNEMQQLHKDGNLKTPLNVIHYTAVIDAFMCTQQIDWMNRAEQLFQRMLKSPALSPVQGTYTVYLVNWMLYKGLTLEQWHRCKAVLNDALERSKAFPTEPLVKASIFGNFMVAAQNLKRDDLAEQTFVELCQWNNSFPVPSMTPDVHCMTALLRTYANTSRPDLAERILSTLIKSAREKSSTKWTPLAYHFEMIIKSWLQQTESEEDGLERAGKLLLYAVKVDREFRLDISPKYLYWIITAWARSGRHDAPSQAAALLKAFQSQSKMDVRKDYIQLVEKMQSPSFQRQLREATSKKSKSNPQNQPS
jgi:hypothetical protein